MIEVYGSLDELLDDASSDEPVPGPLRGKPAFRARLRDARDYVAAMRRLVPIETDAPLEVWSGRRDDGALRALADEHGLRGPVVRLLGAMDSAGTS